MPTVATLLAARQGNVLTVTPAVSVLQAARKMNDSRVGSLVVVDDQMRDRIVGIITERDILTRIVAVGKPAALTAVAEVMTDRVLTCTPATAMDEVRAVMREKRIRHVPVVDGQGRLIGMVSIGDLNQAHAQVLEETIQYLEQYSVRM